MPPEPVHPHHLVAAGSRPPAGAAALFAGALLGAFTLTLALSLAPRTAHAQAPAPATNAPAPAPAPSPSTRTPSAAEQTAFDAAVRTLKGGFPGPAADAFAAFLAGSPDSPLAPQAILLEARARADLGQLDAAVRLLGDRLDRVGTLRDQALELRGEIELRRGHHAAAVASFHQVVTGFPSSPFLLRASFHEALALFRSGQAAAAASKLSDPAGAFHRASSNQPNDELAVRGQLLLAESQLHAGAAQQARATLDRLTNRPLTPLQGWDRQLLVTSLLLTNRETPAALDASSALLAAAAATASRDAIARSQAVRAGILRLAGLPDEAYAALTNNLADGTPPDWRRDALLAVAELPHPPGRVEAVIAQLAPLAGQAPTDPAVQAARLAVAELRLQQHFGTPPPASNRLAEARLLVTGVLSNQPAPPVAGRAWYDLGWIELAQVPPRTPSPAAVEAFQQAVGLLPASPLRGVALFKLADSQLAATNPAAAATNFLRVVREHGQDPVLGRGVLERALYQGALAALVAGQQSLANELAGRAVIEFPEGAFRDDTRVLYGQTLARLEPPGLAREVLQQLATRLTNSPALPEIQLNVARSYFREGSWSNALQHLDDWTRAYPAHASIPRAEFERGWAAFRTGDDARALGLFTNFLARHPDHPSAPQAQMWVGDHLFRNSQFAAAEAAYQLVYQRTNWPVTLLTHEARLMAGRAAFARQGYKDAKPYFLWLIANGPPAITNSIIPAELVARAYFALGDCFLQDPETDDRLDNAMTAFYNVVDKFPTAREALLARGKLANTHLARAGLDPSQAAAAYAEASRLYREIMAPAAGADIAARSQAEIGLAVVLEKQAASATSPDRERLLGDALARLLNVFHAGNLNPGESASPFWLNRAGVEAARLAESLGQREQAAGLYESLARTFPASATAFRQSAARLRTPR